MVIRKSFKFNGMHIVRKCSSNRCKKSLHSHTYKVELFFESDSLDKGFMVMDFGLMKYTIKDIVKSFDNAYSLWDQEDDSLKDYIYNSMSRVVTLPVSPSAESYAYILYELVNEILRVTQFNNGESFIRCSKVSVHETKTGFATFSKSDKRSPGKLSINIDDIKFSKAIKKSWSDPKMYKKLKKASKNGTKIFINPIIED